MIAPRLAATPTENRLHNRIRVSGGRVERLEETMPFPRSEYGRLRDYADRILFGSDFPNIPYGFIDAMRVLTRLPGIDDEWLRKVFHDNAAQLFGLTGPNTRSGR